MSTTEQKGLQPAIPPDPTTALARAEKPPLVLGERGVQTPTADELMRVAKAMILAKVTPEGDTAETVFIKLLGGVEHGFPLTAALKVMAVVKGRLVIEGKGLLAIIRRSRVGRVVPGNGGEGEGRYGFCDWERFDTGEKGRVVFTKGDAKTAGLLGKPGDVYKNYLDDMLLWRAVSRTADRHFSDITLGLESRETAETFEPTPYTPGGEPAAPRPFLPPAEPDPLLGSAAPAPEREPGSDDCPHPDVPEARMKPGGLGPGESIACEHCGQAWEGPKAAPAPSGKQGRLA